MPDDSTRPDQPDGQQRFRADLLAYLDSLPVQPCGRVLELLDTHIGGIDQTIRVLQELRATLCGPGDTARASSQRGEEAVVCRLIESQAPPRPAATSRDSRRSTRPGP